MMSSDQEILHPPNAMPPSLPYLFVVDDDDAARAATDSMARACGWRARTFASADECLAQLATDVPDCILSDLDMPDMDGAAFAQALSAGGLDVPVIGATGQAPDEALVARARALKAHALLFKPYCDMDLRMAVVKAKGNHRNGRLVPSANSRRESSRA